MRPALALVPVLVATLSAGCLLATFGREFPSPDPREIAGGIPEAIAKDEADERKIISTCQAPGFTPDKLKELYKQIRPGTY